MPISKRSTVVSLTKLRKKKFRGEEGREAKAQWMESVREACREEGQHIYLVEFINERNTLLKVLRERLKPGRLFYGKNRVMQRALGLEVSTECLPNIHQVARQLTGHRCLITSSLTSPSLRQLARRLETSEYARAGFIATQDIILEEGEEALGHFPHCLEERLRSLGLPTVLREGKIILLGKYTVATKGEALSTQQAQLLKHLGIKMARFRMKVIAEWHDGRCNFSKE